MQTSASPLALLIVGTCLFASVELSAQDLPAGVRRIIIPHGIDSKRMVEVYWTAPEGTGPWPTILYVHGHQFGDKRPGARRYVDRGILRRMAERGLLAAAVSQPGYGASDGPPDFCGPRSQGAVETALVYLRKQTLVRKSRIILTGYSRGAVVASMVATRDSALCGVILGGGMYDMAAHYAKMGSTRLERAIKANIDKEAGNSAAAFRARSALLADPSITVPTLILHGEDDVNCPPAQARQLAERLRAAGTKVTLAMFPGVAHSIPRDLYDKSRDAFLAITAFAADSSPATGKGRLRVSGFDELDKARRQFAATVKKAQADYDAVIQEAAEKLRAKIQVALARATKEKKLDQAKALMSELDGLSAGALPVFGMGNKVVPGTWRVVYHPNGVRRTYVIKSNGRVSCAEGSLKGQIKRDGADLFLDLNDGKLERITFAGGRIFVEHFNPRDAFPQIVEVGIGERDVGR